MNGPGGSSAKASVIDKQDVDNMRQYNVETERQNSFFGDYNHQRKILNEQLKQQKSNLEAVQKSLWGEWVTMNKSVELLNNYRTQIKQLETEYANTSKLDIKRRIELNAQINSLKGAEAKLAEQVKATNADFIEQSKKLAEVELALEDTNKQIAALGTG